MGDVWYYGNQIIEVVSSFKYLGCFMSAGGSFSTCIQDLTSRARKVLFALKVQFHKNPEITPSIQLKLFNSLVSPILTYSSGSC